MKTTNQNEMDLLLRALARDSAARSQTGSLPQSQEIGKHLDADELNCFAEGIVSGAERLRYNKHLADCDRCRSIVVGLVPVVPRDHEAVKRETGWSWREKLGALFAPSVMRFAMPALALAAIIAIAIVVLRRPQQTDFLAQNQEQASPTVSSSSESGKTTTSDAPQSVGSPGQRPVAESKEKTLSDDRSARFGVQPPAVAPKTSSSTASRDRAGTGFIEPPDSSGVAQSQPTFGAEPTEAAAPPPPRPAVSDASKAAEARKQDNDADLQKRRSDDNLSQSRAENEVARAGPSKGGPFRNNSANVGGMMSRPASKDEKAAGNAVEARRVSGRLFHREGNAWVDSDYASGRATVNVKRGSEQFRALVADEPALRSIAEQLGGEVIVVWKGTAYRIR